MKDVYQVAATGLNMRELPDPGADVLVTLPRNHFVTRLDKRDWGQGWWRVEADMNMLTYQGYVSSKFLTPYAPDGSGPGKTSISAADLTKVVPNALPDLVAKLAPAFQQELPRAQINTGLRIAHFVAQMAHESAFRYMEEIGPPEYFSRYDGRSDLGNTQPGDGLRFKGRGIIQLTGRANYGVYSQKLGVDLVSNPDLAKDPIVATKVACMYWSDRRINDAADADDVYTVTRRINGGQKGIEDRIMKLKIAKAIWVGASAKV